MYVSIYKYIYIHILLCIIMCIYIYISWIFCLTVPTYRCNCSSWWPETSSCSWSKLYRCWSYLHSGLDPSVGKSCINRVTLIILHLQSVSFHHVNSNSKKNPYGPYVACFWVPPDSAFGLCSILCLPTQKGFPCHGGVSKHPWRCLDQATHLWTDRGGLGDLM